MNSPAGPHGLTEIGVGSLSENMEVISSIMTTGEQQYGNT